MSTIPTSLTEEEFNQHALPHLSTAKRGFVCKIDLYKVFNYILYRLYTGCQWSALPIERDPSDPEKKRSVMMLSIITFANGAEMALWKKSGQAAF